MHSTCAVQTLLTLRSARWRTPGFFWQRAAAMATRTTTRAWNGCMKTTTRWEVSIPNAWPATARMRRTTTCACSPRWRCVTSRRRSSSRRASWTAGGWSGSAARTSRRFARRCLVSWRRWSACLATAASWMRVVTTATATNRLRSMGRHTWTPSGRGTAVTATRASGSSPTAKSRTRTQSARRRMGREASVPSHVGVADVAHAEMEDRRNP
mmetsp:Transcript_38717/g.99007  ORF Transcript_38717/g.99007 Transcript_38717/m.99007 type:complete len:211 (+) Transcript_38717:1133-1765(+)